MFEKRNVILYIAMSLDGFIADINNELDFLTSVEHEGEDYGYENFIRTVDTVIIGRKTFDKVVSMGVQSPHSDKNTFVITRKSRASIGSISFYTESLKDLIMNLKAKSGKNIFCDGGAEIVNELLKLDLIDEFYISIIPVLLGNGIRLFNNNRPELYLKLIDCKYFDSGLVQLHFSKK